MSVNIFSLEGDLRVTGIPETKAGLEGVSAAGKQAAVSAAEVEAALKKMGLAGAGLSNAMRAAAAGGGMGPSGPFGPSMTLLASQTDTAGLAFRRTTDASSKMIAGMSDFGRQATQSQQGTESWQRGLANLRGEMEHGTGTLKKHNEGIMGTFESLKHLAEIYGLIKIAEFTKEAIEEAAALQELHQKTGASVEMLSVLTFAGKHAGIGANELAMAFRGFGMALENLERDASPRAIQAFGKLGLSIKSFQGLNTDEKFALIVEALKHIPDGMEKSAIASDVLGRSATVLLPLVDELGRKGIPAMTEEAKKFGAVISEQTAKDAHQLEIEITQLGFAFDKLERLAIPPLTKLIEAMTTLFTMKPPDWWNNTMREGDTFWGTLVKIGTGHFGPLNPTKPGPEEIVAPELAGDASAMRAARALGKGRPFLPFDAGGKKEREDQNPLGTEISLLKEKFELNRAGAADLTRLFVLEGQLTKALDGKNLSMKEELKLARDLEAARKAIIAAGGPLLAPDNLPGGAYDPLGLKDPNKPLTIHGKGGIGALGDMRAIINALVAPQPSGGRQADAANKWFEEQLQAGEAVKLQFANLGKNLGMAVANSFATALSAGFQGKNPFKAFGQAILGAIGGIMVQMGQAMIAQGIVLVNLLPFLSNPFTSGPALIAAGVVLSALGMTLGAIMQGGGGGGHGGGGSFAKDQVTQIHLTADGAGGWMAPKADRGQVVKVLGKDSPEGQRLFAEYGGKTARRGF